MNGSIVVGSAVVGLLVGLTGAGGGALMTPMLILLFSVKPSAAISSDLVASLVMRPLGAAVHLRRGTVNLPMVGWLALGSVPAALLGTLVLHLLGRGASAADDLERALGAVLLLGALAMAVRWVTEQRTAARRTADVHAVRLRPALTVGIGAAGGFVVGMTSVGAGSLMVVALTFAYPALAARRLVGTDLVQAIPLTAAAALGAALFGSVDVPVTTSLIGGSVPAVLVGSLLSSRVDSGALRPVIGVVIFASGLKYVGVPPTPLFVAAGAVAAVVLAVAVTLRLRPLTVAALVRAPASGPRSPS